MRLSGFAGWIVTVLLTVNGQAWGNAITGVVSVQGTGQPIPDGFVQVFRSTGAYVGLASINNSGVYTYSGLAPGSYFIRTADTGYFDELWNNIPCAQEDCVVTSGTPIVVASSPVTADFALVRGGSITGAVTVQGTGQPIPDGFVQVFRSTGAYIGLASINNSGVYTYSGLAPGSYFIRTTDTGYFDELWNNIPCAQEDCVVTSGTPIVVASSPVTADFALVRGGSITGAVTVQGTGQPIPDGFVQVFRSTGAYIGLASINNSGVYTYSGLAPGSYFIRTTDTGYFDELWNNLPCPDNNCTVTSGTPIAVASGPVTADFALTGGGSITGTVTAIPSGQPIPDGFVQVFRSTGAYVGLASINNSGVYTYSGLAPGSYFIRTADTGYFDELWNNIPCAQEDCVVTSGTPIVVASSPVTADFALVRGGSITGAVTVQGTGQPIPDGFVQVFRSTGAYIGLASINNSGVYTYSGLAQGTYYARTTNTGHLDELWNNIPCAQGSCTITSGTPIGVPVSGLVTVNFQLGGSDFIFANGFQ